MIDAIRSSINYINNKEVTSPFVAITSSLPFIGPIINTWKTIQTLKDSNLSTQQKIRTLNKLDTLSLVSKIGTVAASIALITAAILFPPAAPASLITIAVLAASNFFIIPRDITSAVYKTRNLAAV